MFFSDFTWLNLRQPILEMANMRPARTGLVATVHIMSKGGAKHGPRVKVSNISGTFHPSDNFTVTAEIEPRVIGTCKLRADHLADILDWVKLNRDHIKLVWENGDDMDPEDIGAGFVRL